ncbi:MAG: cytosolic protein [Desulfofustis sp.]|nr:cytosolic protein [Desulfofustis sp.]
MTDYRADNEAQLDREETARYIVDLFHRIILHHGMWYGEVQHQMGPEKALVLLEQAFKTSFGIQMNHLGKIFGFEMVDGIPSVLLDMDESELAALKDRLAKNWLVNDGVWFQTIEKSEGQGEAKRCNDSCWAHFSPFEAKTISQRLGLSAAPGLEGLKRALGFRVYASINEQSIVDEGEKSFVFQMNNCRVQAARKRKGLPDYPCKSAGLVEYSYFARSVDWRIKTECVGCPPDDRPEEWFCAWRFYLD